MSARLSGMCFFCVLKIGFLLDDRGRRFKPVTAEQASLPQPSALS